MSKNRWVNTRFWVDNYIEQLSPIEKLVFLYCITNDNTGLCGAYEIPMRHISADTGIDRETLCGIFDKFSADGKIFYEDGYVIVRNFRKYQADNSNIKIGIEREEKLLPQHILDRLTKPFESVLKDTDTLLKPIPILRPKPKLISNLPTPPASGSELEFTYWQMITGTQIRTKFDENIKAAHRLKEKLGPTDFKKALETIKILRADKYAGKSLHVIGNYIQLEKNIEAVEAYRKGIEDRPAFDQATTPKIHSYD